MRRLLFLALFAFAVVSPATADIARFQCRGAILGAGKPGEERLEYFDDRHGPDVELWCVRGVFAAHFDLRIGWTDQSSGVHRSRTIAGCFFDDGRNSGPNMTSDDAGTYARVEWINRSPPSKNTTYRFSYDYRVDKVTITVESACHAPISKIVAPQDNIDRLEALLPEPPRDACVSDRDLPPGG